MCSWSEQCLDSLKLQSRMEYYIAMVKLPPEIAACLHSLVTSPVGKAVLELPGSALDARLLNDAYKATMHKMYSTLCTGISCTFALNVRWTPTAIEFIRKVDPELFEDLVCRIEKFTAIRPYDSRTQAALAEYFQLHVDEGMITRAHKHGVAAVTWRGIAGVELAFATGPVESASHVETNLTQSVQECMVRAQARRLFRDDGLQLDRSERLANSLAHMALVVQQLNDIPHNFQMALFAGRRSSDRRLLLLQNLFCAKHLRGYMGTSAIFAVDLLDEVQAQQGVRAEERKALLQRLIGTHAHEVVMVVQQLLSQYDEQAGRWPCGAYKGPVCVTALLAHLMLLRAVGKLQSATALPDTFTTRSFVAVAAAADVPEEFRADMLELYGDTIPKGAKCFDLFRIWRLDSGDYTSVAELVVSAWEARSREAELLGQAPAPRPSLMWSNLSSVHEVQQMAQLPERLRPSTLAFGGLVDGFLPFESGKGQHQLKMSSIVMKVVQASAKKLGQPRQACAGKLGDDVQLSKIQLDPRLPHEQAEAVKQQLLALAAPKEVHPEAVSAALAAAYHAVTREGVLMSDGL